MMIILISYSFYSWEGGERSWTQIQHFQSIQEKKNINFMAELQPFWNHPAWSKSSELLFSSSVHVVYEFFVFPMISMFNS